MSQIQRELTIIKLDFPGFLETPCGPLCHMRGHSIHVVSVSMFPTRIAIHSQIVGAALVTSTTADGMMLSGVR